MPGTCGSHWPKENGLKVGHLNINHFLNKFPQIPSIIYNTNLNFHLFGFSETWLPNDIKETTLNVPGYVLEKSTRNSIRELGLLVYIHQNVTYKRLSQFEQFGVECIWLEIKLKQHAPIMIGYFYRHPDERVEWRDKFTVLMDAVSLIGKEIIILGDFNQNLIKNNRLWTERFEPYNLTQIIDCPTRVAKKSKTLIDHIYVSSKKNIVEKCVPTNGCSDHLPVCITWNKKGIKIPKSGHKYVTSRCFTKFDSILFLRDLDQSNLMDVFNKTEPEEAMDHFVTVFSNIYDKHAPFKTRRVKQTETPKWLTPEIQKAMDLRDKLLEDEGHTETFCKQRNFVTSLLRKSKKVYFSEQATSNSNNKTIWKAIDQITNKDNRKRSTVINEISSEELNVHFTNTGCNVVSIDNTKNNGLETLIDFCSKKLTLQPNMTLPFISVYEVFESLKSLKTSKTHGLDGIDSAILKMASPYITEPLTFIYNLCIEKTTFPKVLKKAKVLPIYKNGDRSDPSNYRPISILSSLSKPLELHISNAMVKHLTKNNLLHPNQHGFRTFHSCQTALTSLVDT